MGGYDAYENFRTIRRHMKNFLEGLPMPTRDITLISGGALGIDQFWMEVGLHLGLSVIAALPFEGYDAKWPKSDKQKYADLLDKCSEVRYICEPGYVASKLQKRNEWMVDNSNLLVAYWNGSTGGTNNCLQYANTIKHDIQVFHLKYIIES